MFGIVLSLYEVSFLLSFIKGIELSLYGYTEVMNITTDKTLLYLCWNI